MSTVNPCLSNDGIDFSNESEDSSRGIDPEGVGPCNLFSTSSIIMPVVTEPEDIVDEVVDDLDDEEEAEDEEDVKYISCNSESAEALAASGDIQDIELKYDYEIHMIEDADLVSSVQTFESDLLKAVAAEFGLTNCDIARRSLRNGRKLSSSSVVGLGAYPYDTEDPIHTTCEVDLSSDCTPIIGQMTAWVDTSSSRRRLSESDLYKAIEDFSNTYKTDDVVAISYIGTRPDTVAQANVPFIDRATKDDGNTSNLVASSNSSMTPGSIAGIVVASLFALLALLALLVVAKKRQDRKKAKYEVSANIVNDTMSIEDDNDNDDLKQVNDDESVETEDYTLAETLPSSPTFDSEGGREPEEAGFEVQL